MLFEFCYRFVYQITESLLRPARKNTAVSSSMKPTAGCEQASEAALVACLWVATACACTGVCISSGRCAEVIAVVVIRVVLRHV